MKKDNYHHGDLERALLQTAHQTIREEGVEALTLRGVAARLGVSRTALYRHFADKAALLARVAAEGFRMLGTTLEAATRRAREDGLDPLGEMASAYVQFAVENQSHYRAMFGRAAEDWCRYPELVADGEKAFGYLLNAVIDGQTQGRIVPGDPLRLANVLWSAVHGIAMLTLDGQLAEGAEGLAPFMAQCLRDGIALRSATLDKCFSAPSEAAV